MAHARSESRSRGEDSTVTVTFRRSNADGTVSARDV
jgi:hypothetical protein